mmetsp:Transcript_37459/g.94116  ORF Transcript_37459/g.94116 Transcript_37459/m.94116 type:complete len:240 (+) Transcript_37459:303-1022(+)
MRAGEGGHILEVITLALLAFLHRHRECGLDRITHLDGVPWVHNQGAVQQSSSTSKFTENENSLFFKLRCYVLIGNQVHTIPNRAHNGHISQFIEGTEFWKSDRLIQKDKRSVPQGSIDTVDTTNSLIYVRDQSLVFRYVCSRWNSDLNQGYTILELRICLEKVLKGSKFLRKTFDVVEAIYAQQQESVIATLAKTTFQYFFHFKHILIFHTLDKVGRIDSNRERTDTDVKVVVGHCDRC